MSNLGMHCYITGIVQGVFYRRHAKHEAQALDLTGWVRNLDDGRVELVAFGPDDKLDKLMVWMQQGSPRAKVTNVERKDIPYQAVNGFIIK